MRGFDLVEPTTLEHACDFIADNDGAKVIAGNLAHGDYQSDPTTVLIALDATVELLSRAQTRQRKSKKGSRRND